MPTCDPMFEASVDDEQVLLVTVSEETNRPTATH